MFDQCVANDSVIVGTNAIVAVVTVIVIVEIVLAQKVSEAR